MTLSLDDLFNTRSIRAATRIISNDKFPAVFGGTDNEFQTNAAFVNKILKESTAIGTGNISMNGEGSMYQRSQLAKLAIENPIAYVMETKSMITHVLLVLFGLAPEHFFSAYEVKTARKTQYYKHRQKSIIGRILSFVGVVEDHMKGTLHFHFIFFGSISSYVLQELSQLQDVCDVASEALDSFITAKFSKKTNARNLVQRVLCKSTNIKNLRPHDQPAITCPPLLQRQKPLIGIETSLHSKECKLEKSKKVTANERAKYHFHEHHQTCRKGFNGKCGCCFCKKSGRCNGTHCVSLERIYAESENAIVSTP